MKSKRLIDAELLQAFGGEPPVLNITSGNLLEMRNYLSSISESFSDPTTASIKMTKELIDGPDSRQKIQLYIYEPSDKKDTRPGLLHIHGGGYIMGTAAMDEGFCKKMAHDLDCVVVSVDYRIAPETKFPGALEDCYAALKWMKREQSRLNINSFSITGESAGGGLAASLAFLIRDRAEITIALQFLTYPMLDDRTGATLDPGALVGQYCWPRASNRFGWLSYLGQEPGLDKTPYPSVPSRIENLEGLAPTYIACGSLDLFAPENLLYAQRLVSQGVPTEVHVFPGAPHGFVNFVDTKLGKMYYAERKRAFKAAWAVQS